MTITMDYIGLDIGHKRSNRWYPAKLKLKKVQLKKSVCLRQWTLSLDVGIGQQKTSPRSSVQLFLNLYSLKSGCRLHYVTYL